VIFTALTVWVVFSVMMSSPLTFATGVRDFTPDGMMDTLSGALMIGCWTLIVAGSVSFIVTALVGVPLAWLAVTLLRRSPSWLAHVCALFAVGVIASSVTLVAFGLVTLDYLAAEAVPLYSIAGALAGTSSALGWVTIWRLPARRTADDYAESLASR
jgi:hypothetical protein